MNTNTVTSNSYLSCCVLLLAFQTQAADIVQQAREPALAKGLIRKQPEDQTVKFGADAVFRVGVEAPDAQYQWYKDFRSIPQATQATLQIENVSKKNLGTYVCVTSTKGENADFAMSEPVSLTAYSFKDKTILLEMWVDPMYCEIMQLLPWNPPIEKAANLPFPRADDSSLIYAATGMRNAFNTYEREPALYFVESTNSITVLPYSVGAGGSAGTGNCPPQYRCVFNFRRLPPWAPIPGVTSGQARHVQSTATVVKFWRDTALSGCGPNGVVTISPLQTGGYRFAIFCPSSVFPTCPSGTHQLELTGFQ
jgi:hypothetical protein